MLMVTIVFDWRDPLVKEMRQLIKEHYNASRFGASITLKLPRTTINVADFLTHKTVRVVCRAHDSWSLQRNMLKSLRDALGLYTSDLTLDHYEQILKPGHKALNENQTLANFRGGIYEVPDATNIESTL